MLFTTHRRLFVFYGLLLIAGSLCIEFAGAQDCTGVVPTYQSRGVILCGGSYPLPSGKIVSQSGTYLDTLRYTTGCDSVIFTIVLDKKVVITNTLDASICDGSAYMLPSGKIIKLPGSYRDVIKYPIGCDSLVTFVNLDVLTKTIKNNSVTICAGQPYALPSGKIINSPGIYSDTLYYTSGCDSVVNIITVSGITALRQSLNMAICAGNSLVLPSGKQVSNPGTYYDTVKYISGCDSLITEVNLSIKPLTTETTDINICQGKNYTLPWGLVVNTSGIYSDTLHYMAGCDSVIRIVQVTTTTPAVVNNSVKICSGASYTLPSGLTVTTPGIYIDTLHNVDGCDSLIRMITVAVKPVMMQNSKETICEGTNYNLPWGNTATIAGTYSDTLHYTTGCDSLIRSVQLTVKNVERKDSSLTICSGQTFIAPSGISIKSTGIYLDTLRYTTGCDSIIYRLSIVVNSVTKKSFAASVCDGSSYMLPSGKIISLAGNYPDTLRYVSGCDSIIYSVQLITNSAQHQDTTVSICSGHTYTIPSGLVVNKAGMYTDTLHYNTGCNSLIRTVQITVNTPTVMNSSATICSGGTYALPWGANVNTAGTYKDTLFYKTGCDSLIRVVNLSISPVLHKPLSLNLCEGGSVVLPWGVSVTTPGLYLDTLHYTNGCDSLISEVTVLLNPVIRRNTTVSFCDGSAYTLPWGEVVTAAGTYRDTLRYVSGCDSVITTIQLTANTLNTITSAASICSNQTFTLPWGRIVSVAGVYADTLRYASGCDSVIRILTLTVNRPTKQITGASVCSGKNYTLPWGATTALPGIYTDTLHGMGGCDSVIRMITLSITPVAMKDTAAVLCSGQFFLSPAGNKIYSPGLYFDTLRYISGCDSIIFRISINGRPVVYKTIDTSVCYGQPYTLPSGKTVFLAGLYKDTLFSSSSCDSIITTVTLTTQTPSTLSMHASICEGQSYTLPWGRIVNTAGVYRDTLKYTTGCDSLVRIVNVQTIAAKTASTNASFCRGDDYILPWGTVVNDPGHYSDTLRSNGGCDSLIYVVNLSVKEKPLISVKKSNDIDCTLGSAKLTATGGNQYQWSPAVGLDKTDVFNPLAAPATTTVYHVQVTSTYGCTSEDSVEIIVTTASSGESFLMPNAFTPNSDNVNDYFSVRHWGTVSNLHFSIYDRWGKLVFYTENPSQYWDGNIKDKELPSGTYVYAISAKTICGDVIRKGTVTLIR